MTTKETSKPAELKEEKLLSELNNSTKQLEEIAQKLKEVSVVDADKVKRLKTMVDNRELPIQDVGQKRLQAAMEIAQKIYEAEALPKKLKEE